MAQKEEVIVKLKIDTGDSAKDIAEVSGAIEDVSDSSKKATKSAENAKGAFSSLGQAIKTLGAATIILKVFEKFGEILGQNSKITKILATATEALSIIVGDFVNFIVDNTQPVIDFFKNAFENPTKFASNLGNAIKANLIERFNSLLEVAGFVSTAFKKLFAGDFAGAAQAAKEAGKELVDVATGVEDTTGKIGELAEKVLDYGKNVLKTAKDNVELANSAEIAAARLQGLIESADRDAELQRQIRDDVSKSVSERIKANEQLGKVLEVSQAKQLQQAELLLQAADANLKKDATNQQFILAKIGAENQLAAIRAQSAGFRSEQLVNETALLLEQQNLEKSRILNFNTLLIAQKKANADLIVDEQERAIAKRSILDEEAALEIKRLTDNVNLYKEGTQAKVDAENELATKKQEIENNKLIADNDIRTIYFKRQLEDLQFIQDNELAKFDAKRQAIELEIQANKDLFDAKLIDEREYNKRVAELGKSRVALDIEEGEAKKRIALAVSQTLLNVANLLGKQTAEGKALAVASTTISSIVAAFDAYKAVVGIPVVGPILAPINAGVALAAGYKSIQDILAVNIPGQSGGGSLPSLSAPGTGAGAPIAPTFTPASATALDATSLNAINNVVARAYVVESDITGSQKRIRRIENAARI